MIGPFINAITSNSFQTIAQNTDACVKIETALKAVGRPAFTLMDKNTDKDTRKYAALKELLYQLLCFGIYIAIIPPIFKNGGFKLAQKIFKKEGLPAFQNAKQMLAYHHLAYMTPAQRMLDKNKKFRDLIPATLVNPKDNNAILLEYLIGNEKKGIKPLLKGTMEKQGKMFELAKGSIELSSIIGSVIGLTILAPEISHLILHPIMNALHLKPDENGAVSTDSQSKSSSSEQKFLDKQA